MHARLLPMMEEQIERFPAQFEWQPRLVHGEKLQIHRPVVVCGMGGSHLGARLLALDPLCPPLLIHSDYGLPKLPESWAKDTLYIASSYSGETEETLDAARALLSKDYPLAVIASGGALLALAKERELPHIELPKVDMEPRMTMGYQMIAFAHLFGIPSLENEVRSAGRNATLPEAKARGDELARAIDGQVPFFYASNQNLAIAYHLKASINETGKVPAAYNVVPELCHNELSGYTAKSTQVLPVFLDDNADDARTAARMRLMQDVLKEQGVPSVSFPIIGTSPLHKALQFVLIGNYAGAVIAEKLGVPDAHTPLIGDFKKRLASL